MEQPLSIVGYAEAIVKDIDDELWLDALHKVDEVLAVWDDPRAEITDTKTMDMYEAVRIIDGKVRELAPAFEAAPSEDENDNDKYRKAIEYIDKVRDLISRGGRPLAQGGRRRSKRGVRGKTARRRVRQRALTRRRRRLF